MAVKLTPGQRAILLECEDRPCSIMGDSRKRVAETLIFRKWVTSEGPRGGTWVLTITEAGKKALEEDTSKPRKQPKYTQL